MTAATHIPVMLAEVCAALQIKSGGTYLDATLGRGGYSKAFLDVADTKVIAIDRDPQAIEENAAWASGYGGRILLREGRFGELDHHVEAAGFAGVDGVVFDLGVSSPQIDDPKRGFSFRHDGALDMRMEHSGRTAAEIVNNTSESELADIIFELGGERYARRVARNIVTERVKKPFTSTMQLAALIRASVPSSKDGLDPATRTFQALRIAVNDELDELKRGLAAAELVLKPGGRLAIVSFHSGEDKIAKTFIQERSRYHSGLSRHMPHIEAQQQPITFKAVGRMQRPTREEIRSNPRAASARMRVAERTASPSAASVISSSYSLSEKASTLANLSNIPLRNEGAAK